MKNNIKIFALAAVSLLAFNACKKALVEKPEDFVNAAQLGNSSLGDANVYVNGALNGLNDMYRYGAFPKVLELDNDDITGPDWAMGQFAAGDFSSNWWAMPTMWTGPYQIIKRSNFGIYKISSMSLADAEKNNAMGQLNVLKAYNYFLLVQAYGGVPLYKISLEEGATLMLPRSSVKEVYEYIIETLKLAESQLYSVQNANYKTGRISKGAASSLLAKVYLTIGSASLKTGQLTMMGGRATAQVNGKTVRIAAPSPETFNKNVVAGYEDFDSKAYFKLAMDKAKEVIMSNDYQLFPKYMDIWKVANRNKVENIWQMQAISDFEGLNNGISTDYFGTLKAPLSDIATGTPQVLNGKWYGIRDHWYALFDKNDQRITDGVLHRWQDANGYFSIYPAADSTIVKGTDISPEALAKKSRYGYTSTDGFRYTICTLRKFAGVTDGSLSKHDFYMPIIRYAEVYLIYAEAANEFNNGPTTDAVSYLSNVILRSNPTAAPIGALNQQAFRSLVVEERRKELGLENNRRWDLIRWGVYLDAMNAVDIDENNVLKRRQAKHLLYPIPSGEMSANKLIPINNPGW